MTTAARVSTRRLLATVDTPPTSRPSGDELERVQLDQPCRPDSDARHRCVRLPARSSTATAPTAWRSNGATRPQPDPARSPHVPATTTATANEPAPARPAVATSEITPDRPMVPTDLLTNQPARQPHRRQPDDLFLLTLRQPLHATPPRRRTIIDEVMRSSPETTADLAYRTVYGVRRGADDRSPVPCGVDCSVSLSFCAPDGPGDVVCCLVYFGSSGGGPSGVR